MKNKFMKVVLGLFIIINFVPKSHAQDSELVKLYKEFPDSLFQLYYYHDADEPVFAFDRRTRYLKPCFYDTAKAEYSANMFREMDGYYDNADSKPVPDTSAEDYYSDDYETHYTLKIHEQSERISFIYDYESQGAKLDFIVVRESDSYSVVLLEQYLPGMGVPNLQKFTVCKFDLEQHLLSVDSLSFPQFKWANFYSKRNVKKIRHDLIGEYKIPYKVKVNSVESKVFICLEPDLNELAWRISEVLEFEEDNGVGGAYEDTFEILGLNKLPSAQVLCGNIKGFANRK
jgi:hypothetical protein